MEIRDRHIAAVKLRLTHLSGLAQKSAATEQRIHDAAVARLAAVGKELDALRPQVMLEPAAADDYQALTLERGQLATVIASAQKHLAATAIS